VRREAEERDRAAKEHAEREQAAKEQAAKEQAAKEQAAKEQAAKEQVAKGQAEQEQAAKDAAKEQAEQEQAERERKQKERAEKQRVELNNERLLVRDEKDRIAGLLFGRIFAAFCEKALEVSEHTQYKPLTARLQDNAFGFDEDHAIFLNDVLTILPSQETTSYATDSLLDWVAVNANAVNANTQTSPKHFIGRALDINDFIQRISSWRKDGIPRMATLEETIATLRDKFNSVVASNKPAADLIRDHEIPLSDMPDDTETVSLIYNLANAHYVHIELQPNPSTLIGKIVYHDSLPSSSSDNSRHTRLLAELPLLAQFICLRQNSF
jgi:flagellar motor protein MotB